MKKIFVLLSIAILMCACAGQGDKKTESGADEMEAIRRIDRGCRFIKGQVFMWKTARSWHDLWDEDGVIRK